VIAHAAAHLQLSIFLPSLWQNLFVVSVIVLAPLAAAFLGRMGRDRLGAATLAAAMAGAPAAVRRTARPCASREKSS
jgi:hypothetical protein